MNILYEESGNFKVGSIVTRNDNSMQVDTQHGKRSKVKSASILLEFSSALHDFLPAAETLAADIDIDFLWEVCGSDEFDYQQIAADYFGHTPSPIENAAVLIRLYGAPMYFYKKGKGRFKAAPQEALQAALAGIERKQREQAQIDEWVAQMLDGQLPPAIDQQLFSLLHRPDKQCLEYKAFEAARQKKSTSPLRLAAELGGIRSVPEYLLAGFLLEFFPNGRGFPALQPVAITDDLPLADASAFSIDDSSTTEIDDALSLQPLANGHHRVGIHIAAPGLGIAPDSPVDRLIFKRLSTVYFPGDKITMLPEDLVQQFTLLAGTQRPAFSLYIDVDADWQPVGFENRIERVSIAANLRLHELEPNFNADTLAQPGHGPDYPFKNELVWLWQFAEALEKRRGKYDPTRPVQYDYSVEVDEHEHVTISKRARGTPMDKLVSELMILANSEWARMLAEADIPALYRAQGMGKVRMTTHPEPHVGLGVAQYAWSTSPLRRAADFVNQRQLIALTRGEAPQFRKNDATLFAIMRDFDTTYNAYAAFQDRMEYFWCLRWFTQENVKEITASFIKDDLVRLNGLPMRTRVTGLPPLNRGDTVRLAIVRIDELVQSVEMRFLGVEGHQEPTEDEDELVDIPAADTPPETPPAEPTAQ